MVSMRDWTEERDDDFFFFLSFYKKDTEMKVTTRSNEKKHSIKNNKTRDGYM